MRLFFGIGFCAAAALAACGQPYRQTSRGAAAYKQQMARCEDRLPLADERPRPQPATECPARAAELARMGPYRRFLWVAPVPPPTQEAELDYLCVVPHLDLLEISEQGVFLPFAGNLPGQAEVPPLPWHRPPPGRSDWLRARLHRSVPQARDVRLRIRGTYRRISVREVFRQGHDDGVTQAIWYASGDLDDLLARPRGVLQTARLTRPVQTVFDCGGRWLDFDVPPRLQVQSILEHVTSGDRTELTARFEAALLENARAQFRPNNEAESAEILARRLARDRARQTEHLGLPLLEQQLRVTVQMPQVPSGTAGRDEIWSVELPVNELLVRPVSETQSVVLRGARYELELRLDPVEPLGEPPFGDFSSVVHLDVTLHGRDGRRVGGRLDLVLQGTHDAGTAFVDKVEQRPREGDAAGSGYSIQSARPEGKVEGLVLATIPSGPSPGLRPRSGEGRE